MDNLSWLQLTETKLKTGISDNNCFLQETVLQLLLCVNRDLYLSHMQRKVEPLFSLLPMGQANRRPYYA